MSVFFNRWLLSGVLGLFACAQVAASELPGAWLGSWISAPDSQARVGIVMSQGGKHSLQVDELKFEISSVQVSPDKRTLLVYWASGEGTFVRSDDGGVLASLFDRKFPIRTVQLRRE